MTSPRVHEVWGKLAPFLETNMNMNGCPPNFNHEIHNILSLFTYPHEEKEGPLCSKVVESCKTSDMQTSHARIAP